MSFSIDAAIAYMYQLQKNGVTYSMDGSRVGTDGTADCSGAVYAALRTGGMPSGGYVLNTESMHGWLLANGWKRVADDSDWNAQRGDVFIWGKIGQSGGAGGHTGIFVDHDNIIHCNYAHNGVSINNHDAYWAADGCPYFYAYRYEGVQTSVQPVDFNVITALGGYNSVWADGYQHQSTHSKFTYQSQWRSCGIVAINSLPYYQLSSSEWYPQYATTLANICQINYKNGVGVLAVDRNGKQIAGSNAKFKAGTRWKCSKYLTSIKGQWYYQVSPSEFIPLRYAVGCGIKYNLTVCKI
ncbi:peptidoglycan amidohydrolase family protein [Schleiferilactobacillus perolens]|uniref:peptidoglycan amidohydrolase family protein n=1 Tax=Schleiferilactobacillus perolens TaxID=100468 RepID=UPI0023567FEA|nr:peptidoglycan amidohydrolase family protein [Schleiferilactobacillus perolens]MCI2172371.1 SLAP domain-containing protein [Schleiferilactobacillus perolens]